MSLKTSLQSLIVITSLVSIVLLQGNIFKWGPVDDAYISLRYAKNLADGYGLVFNKGEKVEGYSNFFWTIIIAECCKLGFDACHAALSLSIFFSCLCILMTWWLSRWIASERGWPDWLTFIPPLLMASYPGLSYWGFSAMEPAMLACLVTAFIYFGCQAASDHFKIIPTALFGILAALTRWETVILWPVIVVYLFTCKNRGKGSRILKPALVSILLLSGFGIYFFWRASYYGDMMPNTFYAKAAGPLLLRVPRGLVYTGELAVSWWLPVSIVLWITNGLKGKSTVLLASMLLYMLYVTWTGGDHFAWLRFYMPVLPIAALMAAELIKTCIDSLKNIKHVRLATIGIIVGFVAVFTGTSMRIDYMSAQKHLQFVRWWEKVGMWSKDAFPDSYRLAVIPAGIIPYLSEHPVLDLMGLTDRWIAHFGDLDPTEAPGHQRSSVKAVFNRKPEVVLGEALPFDHPPTQAEVLLETHRNVLKKLYQMPLFNETYDYKTVRIGNRFTSYWVLK